MHEEFQGIRITPNLYTTLGELDRFCEQMELIARKGLPSPSVCQRLSSSFASCFNILAATAIGITAEGQRRDTLQHRRPAASPSLPVFLLNFSIELAVSISYDLSAHAVRCFLLEQFRRNFYASAKV